MVFILLGVLLVALKLAEIAPVAEWPWWIVLMPFALAVAWWAFSDRSGLTRRRSMNREQERKLERRRNLAQGQGLLGLFDRSVSAKMKRVEAKEKAARQRQIDKIENERERKRQANRDSILTTRMDSRFDSRLDSQSSTEGRSSRSSGAPGDAASQTASGPGKPPR